MRAGGTRPTWSISRCASPCADAGGTFPMRIVLTTLILLGTLVGCQPSRVEPTSLEQRLQQIRKAGPGMKASRAPATLARTYTREWYVATTGNDGASGSSGAPFRTLQKAISMAGPGERINVRSGTYSGRVLIHPGVRGGTASAPIVLQGEGARLVYDGPEFTIVQVERPYWHIDGFVIDAEGRFHMGVGFLGETQGSSLSR